MDGHHDSAAMDDGEKHTSLVPSNDVLDEKAQALATRVVDTLMLHALHGLGIRNFVHSQSEYSDDQGGSNAKVNSMHIPFFADGSFLEKSEHSFDVGVFKLSPFDRSPEILPPQTRNSPHDGPEIATIDPSTILYSLAPDLQATTVSQSQHYNLSVNATSGRSGICETRSDQR